MTKIYFLTTRSNCLQKASLMLALLRVLRNVREYSVSELEIKKRWIIRPYSAIIVIISLLIVVVLSIHNNTKSTVLLFDSCQYKMCDPLLQSIVNNRTRRKMLFDFQPVSNRNVIDKILVLWRVIICHPKAKSVDHMNG